jgi:hypothetical protein
MEGGGGREGGWEGGREGGREEGGREGRRVGGREGGRGGLVLGSLDLRQQTRILFRSPYGGAEHTVVWAQKCAASEPR